ncbi:phosphotransferase [Escherichia coli]
MNHELCKITEDLIFTEPYYNAERNNWTSPELDDAVHKAWADVEMIQVAMRYKYKFMTEAQALLHGDLHSGSIMVTDTDTKVIDPEFGFMGPMAFDIGNYIGNLLLAYFSRPGWDANEQRRADYQEWLLQQIVQTWSVFTGSSASSGTTKHRATRGRQKCINRTGPLLRTHRISFCHAA